jgi:ketosteroid isomerase-like protein
MMADAELLTELQARADRDAVTDLLYRYADRVDARDVVGLSKLFADEATADLLGFRPCGATAICEHLGRVLGGFTCTSHHVSNPLVDLHGDRAEITASVYAYHRRRRSGEPWHFWGRYYATAARDGHGWRLRHLVLVGIDGGPDVDPSERTLYTGHPERRFED